MGGGAGEDEEVDDKRGQGRRPSDRHKEGAISGASAESRQAQGRLLTVVEIQMGGLTDDSRVPWVKVREASVRAGGGTEWGVTCGAG